MGNLAELERRMIAAMLGVSVFDVEMTPTSFILRHGDLTTQLKKNANRDYEAYKREVYAASAARYRQQTPGTTYEVKTLFDHFDGFRKWLKSGEQTLPDDYTAYGSYQVRRDVHGTMKQEWMVMLPAYAFGLHIVISLDTLIDLLRLLKSQKVWQVKVRAVPIMPRIHPTKKSYQEETYHWSALEIQNGSDVYQLYSDTNPEFDAQQIERTGTC